MINLNLDNVCENAIIRRKKNNVIDIVTLPDLFMDVIFINHNHIMLNMLRTHIWISHGNGHHTSLKCNDFLINNSS